jgi:hypothetical protein
VAVAPAALNTAATAFISSFAAPVEDVPEWRNSIGGDDEDLDPLFA